MNIHLYYFSGTGNTAWLAHRLAQYTTVLGHQTIIISCEDPNLNSYPVEMCDQAGFLFPIYASFAPDVFQKFIDTLPPVNGKSAFLIASAGYTAGDVSVYVGKLLSKKGYTVFLTDSILMGNNLHLPTISPLPATAGDKMCQRLQNADLRLKELAEIIHHQESHIAGNSIVDRLLGFGQRAFYRAFEKVAFKPFYANSSCTQCQWCLKQCPVGAISWANNHPIFNKNCIHCMRCYSFCPVSAIQYSSKTEDTTKYPRFPGPEGKKAATVFR